MANMTSLFIHLLAACPRPLADVLRSQALFEGGLERCLLLWGEGHATKRATGLLFAHSNFITF